MKAFSSLSGVVALLDRNNVDTDAIIPKQFMKTIGRTGLGQFAFDAWRYLDEGYWGQDCSNRPKNAGFELNQARYQNASILLTRKNFGCGSSREHAPWALADLGLRAIVAESFADIFYTNCLKNGILAISLPQATIQTLVEEVQRTEGLQMSINLKEKVLSTPGASRVCFELDESWRERLLNGWDDISITLRDEDAIRKFELNHMHAQPWLFD